MPASGMSMKSGSGGGWKETELRGVVSALFDRGRDRSCEYGR